MGTSLGKFTKTGKFRLNITALDYLAKYANIIKKELNFKQNKIYSLEKDIKNNNSNNDENNDNYMYNFNNMSDVDLINNYHNPNIGGNIDINTLNIFFYKKINYILF